MKALLYCCKNKPYINKYGDDITDYPDYVFANEGINGRIVAECDYEVEEIIKKHSEYFKYCYITESLNEWELMYKSLLDGEMMNDYLRGNKGYAIHIKNLHIFDEPKELSEYYNRVPMMYGNMRSITSAPQNMRYVEDYFGHKYVLISIRPEWLCKILNGKKTIEVRKKVLKEMIKYGK